MERLREIVKRLKELREKANVERRELSADEQGEFDRLSAEARTLKAAQTRAQDLEDLEAFVTQPAERRTPPPGPDQMRGGTPGDPGRAPAAVIPIEEREKREYSLRALCGSRLSGNPNESRVERYYSDELREQMGGKAPQGLYIPYRHLLPVRTERMLRAREAAGIPYLSQDEQNLAGNAELRTVILKTAKGAGVIGVDFMPDEFIELLRAESIVVGLGARVLGGLVGDVDIPRQKAASIMLWLATETTDLTIDNTWESEKVQLRPKTAGIRVDVTRRMQLQSTPGIEDLIREDIRTQIALGIDAGAINGSGASGQPTGILSVSGIGSVDMSTASTWADCVEFETDLGTANALRGRLAYAMPPSVRGVLKTTPKGANTFGFLMEPDGTLNGYPTRASTQVPAATLIFGNWADMLIGQWGALDLLADPYTLGNSGGLVIRDFQDVDVVLRHPASFSASINVA